MRIVKIMDGFITNSSTVATTIVVAMKKGEKLEEMLEKIGLSPDFTSRFDEDERYPIKKRIQWNINDGFLDESIYDLENEYDILMADIIIGGFGDGRQDIDRTAFGQKFGHDLINKYPIRLVGDKFILLYNIADYLESDTKHKNEYRKKMKDFIDELVL